MLFWIPRCDFWGSFESIQQNSVCDGKDFTNLNDGGLSLLLAKQDNHKGLPDRTFRTFRSILKMSGTPSQAHSYPSQSVTIVPGRVLPGAWFCRPDISRTAHRRRLISTRAVPALRFWPHRHAVKQMPWSKNAVKQSREANAMKQMLWSIKQMSWSKVW